MGRNGRNAIDGNQEKHPQKLMKWSYLMRLPLPRYRPASEEEPTHHTYQLTFQSMAHIFIRVCALIYNGVSPLTFARYLGHQYLLKTAEVIPCLLAPPSRCSRHQAEACCTAQTARDAWRADRTSALASTGRRTTRVPERACRTDATLGQSPEHGPGVRCKTIQQLGHVSPDV